MTTCASERRSRARLRLGALAAASAFAFAAGCLSSPAALSPWRSIRLSLSTALSELESNQPVTDGHRERAIELVRKALAEVDAARVGEPGG